MNEIRSLKIMLIYAVLTVLALFCSSTLHANADEADPLRSLPARTLPVPSTVSAEMQQAIAQPLHPSARFSPKSNDQWREILQKASRFKPKAL